MPITYQHYPYALEAEGTCATGNAGTPVPESRWRRAHSGFPATDGILSGDQLGQLVWLGFDPNALATQGAQLRAEATADWTPTTHPTRLVINIEGVDSVVIDKTGIITGLPVTSQPWTISGAFLQPTDATKVLYTPGAASAIVPHIFGANTIKGRIQTDNSQPNTWLSLSVNRDPSSGTVDDGTKPAWQQLLNVNADNWSVAHVAAGGSYTNFLVLDNAGRLTIPGPISTVATDRMALKLGVDTQKMRVGGLAGAPGWYGITANAMWGGAWAGDDQTVAGWAAYFHTASDLFQIQRWAPTTWASSVPLSLSSGGNLTITGKYNAPGLNGATNAAAQTGGTYNSYGTPMDVISQTITTKGGPVIITVNMNLSYIQLGASGNVLVDQYLLRDGGTIAEIPRNMGGAVVTPLVAFTWIDYPAAGAHTYKYQVWMGAGTSGSINGTASNSGTLRMCEIGG